MLWVVLTSESKDSEFLFSPLNSETRSQLNYHTSQKTKTSLGSLQSAAGDKAWKVIANSEYKTQGTSKAASQLSLLVSPLAFSE